MKGDRGKENTIIHLASRIVS